MGNKITNIGITGVLGFSAAEKRKSFIEGLQSGASWEYNVKGDPKDSDGEYLTDGRQAIVYTVSVGHGRGSAKMELNGNDFAPIVASLESFDPELDESGTPVAECVRRTLMVDGDDVVFKVSLAKNSRQTRIPLAQWATFIEIFGGTDPLATEGEAEPIDQSGIPAGECVQQTIASEDGVTTFKVSLAKNSRTVRIPKGELENFIELMKANDLTCGDAVAHYRSIAESIEAAANTPA